MKKYRISKYAPKYRNEKGEYKKNDWTSYADIGKSFNGEKLTVENYIKVEKLYGDIVEKILIDNNVKSVVVEEFERNFTDEELSRLLGSKGLKLFHRDIQLLNNLKDGYVIGSDSVKDVISLILKDCCWCKLVAVNQNLIVEFGYDLYIYMTCNNIESHVISKAEMSEIFIECIS